MKLVAHIEPHLKSPELLRVFGLILFTDRHACLARALSDEFNWRAYDEASGDKMVIFSAKPEWQSNARRRGAFAKLWSDPSENKELLKTFQLEGTERLPLFLVFTRTSAEGEYAKCEIALSDESNERAHSRLMKVIEFACRISEGIAQENLKKSDSVFLSFERQFKEFNEREQIKKFVGWVPFLQKIWKFVPSPDND